MEVEEEDVDEGKTVGKLVANLMALRNSSLMSTEGRLLLDL